MSFLDPVFDVFADLGDSIGDFAESDVGKLALIAGAAYLTGGASLGASGAGAAGAWSSRPGGLERKAKEVADCGCENQFHAEDAGPCALRGRRYVVRFADAALSGVGTESAEGGGVGPRKV